LRAHELFPAFLLAPHASDAVIADLFKLQQARRQIA
jgi:hypothetical protein